MVGILIKDCLKSGLLKKERKFWTSSKALLFRTEIHTTFRTINFILKS